MRSFAKVANRAGIMTKSSYLTLKTPLKYLGHVRAPVIKTTNAMSYGRGSTHAWPPRDLVRLWRPLTGRWEAVTWIQFLIWYAEPIGKSLR